MTGLVTLDRIKHVPTGQRDRTRLADIACPLTDIATAAPQDSVADILPVSPNALTSARWCSATGAPKTRAIALLVPDVGRRRA